MGNLAKIIRADKRAWLRGSAVVIILAVHFSLLFFSAKQKSATSDEPYHISRGVAALFSGDFRLSVGHPPLVNVICALPLLGFSELNVPFVDVAWRDESLPHTYRKQKFFKLLLWVHNWQWEGNEPLKIILFTRIPVMVMSCVLALILYLWGARLFGAPAGFMALMLYAFSPTMLAHARLVTTDTGVTLFITLFVFALSRHLKRPGWGTLLLCGFTFGLAQLSKFTSVLLIPLLPLALVSGMEGGLSQRIRRFFWSPPKSPEFQKSAYAFIIIMLVTLIVIWAGYGFELHSIHRIETPEPGPRSGPGIYLRYLAIKLMAAVPAPPRTYFFGLSEMLQKTAEHYHPLYFMGELSAEGWWYYYPVMFVIKEPLPLLLLVALGIAGLRMRPGLPWQAARPSFIFSAGLLLFFMFFNKKNIGIRHIMVFYPFLFLWISRLSMMRGWRGFLPWAPWVLILFYVVNAFAVYPDYLVHFNRLAGGPEGGLELSVVGEDWGQDIAGLGRFCKERRIRRIYYNPYGNADPRAYGVPWEEFSCHEREPGWYAVHLVSLMRPLRGHDPDCYKDFLDMEPVAVINNTIYVYHIERTQ